MKLVNLKEYIENNQDKEIVNRMLKDNDDALKQYVIGVVCDLLQYVPLDESYKSAARTNFINYDEKSVGELGTYVALFPYVQLKLTDKNDGGAKATELLEALISYIIGYINKDEFEKVLLEITELLDISHSLQQGLSKYFAYNKDVIVNEISKKI